ncbi:MAG: hypothetical protein NVSMB17_00950 [Candidatus Dormibacteria bacterium]
MQPTTEAELASLRRTLAALASDADLPAGVVAELGAATRTLQRLERTNSRVLPYLLSDNAATAELLGELAPGLPEGLRSEIESAVPAPEQMPGPAALDIATVNARNELLRELLARVIKASPVEPPGAGVVRKRVATHLHQSLEMRPW